MCVCVLGVGMGAMGRAGAEAKVVPTQSQHSVEGTRSADARAVVNHKGSVRASHSLFLLGRS